MASGSPISSTTALDLSDSALRRPVYSATLRASTSPVVALDHAEHRPRRRLSVPSGRKQHSSKFQACKPLRSSVGDISNASPAQTIASIRFMVLSYLTDLETKLAELESPDVEEWLSKGELTLEEAKQWLNTALEMLESIRTDVSSHFPELSVENFKSHLPEFPDVPTMDDVRSHLPGVRFQDVMPNLPDMRSKLDDIRARFNDLDLHTPLNYLATVFDHMENLDTHLSSMDLPSDLDLATLSPSAMLSDLLDAFLDMATDVKRAEDSVEQAAKDVANALKRSFEGVQLITYTDLPHNWRNNPFVTHGYRFIPIERWPLILLSLFALHNETLNIHTHLIPFFMWLANLVPVYQAPADTVEILFMGFALLCLFGSALSHTMAGCSHAWSMEFCSRVDYVGIGWLISASVGTVVYYGFQCTPHLRNTFIALCFACGVAGNTVPFMDWFNNYKYRGYRVAFFLSLAFSALLPLAVLARMHSTAATIAFFSPIVPSLVSYIVGLVFYVTHVPECFLPASWRRKLDVVGGGSHAIWHCFIVLAVSQHRHGLSSMTGGIEGRCLA